MAAPVTKERELLLLDKIDFQILAVANREEKLQGLLQKYLTPIILKAASEHAAVRHKVSAYCRGATFWRRFWRLILCSR